MQNQQTWQGKQAYKCQQILDETSYLVIGEDNKEYLMKIQSSSTSRTQVINFFNKVIQQKDKQKKKVLKIYDYFFDEKSFFVIQEYPQGGTLKMYLESQVSVSESILYRIILDVAIQLCQIQKIGFIYQNLNPSTIFIQRKENLLAPGTFMLGNFSGVAEVPKEEGKEIFYQTRCGAITYLTPESLIFNGLNFTTDTWTLGILIYEILQKEPLFDGDNNQEIKKKILKFCKDQGEAHQKIDQLRIDDKIKLFLKQLLHHDYKKRPAILTVIEFFKPIVQPPKIEPQLVKVDLQDMENSQITIFQNKASSEKSYGKQNRQKYFYLDQSARDFEQCKASFLQFQKNFQNMSQKFQKMMSLDQQNFLKFSMNRNLLQQMMELQKQLQSQLETYEDFLKSQNQEDNQIHSYFNKQQKKILPELSKSHKNY